MNYRNLEVYRLAIAFLPLASQLTDRFPPGYASFADQIRRASLSVPLNIAEGSGKTRPTDQKRFYAIARGSAMECGAIVDACLAPGFIDKASVREAVKILDPIVRILSKMCLPPRTRR